MCPNTEPAAAPLWASQWDWSSRDQTASVDTCPTAQHRDLHGLLLRCADSVTSVFKVEWHWIYKDSVTRLAFPFEY